MYFNDNKKNTNINSDFEKKKSNKKIIIIPIIIILIIFLIFLYFWIKKENTIIYYLTLEGNSDVILNKNDLFIDSGYRAYDNKGNDYSDSVTVDGFVDTGVVGEYTITYTFNDIVKKRVITVIEGDSSNDVVYLLLNGDKVSFIKVGEEFNDPGYVVINSNNLKNDVIVKNEVNNKVPGTYKITYSLTLSNGKILTTERTVIVTDSSISLNYSPREITNGNVSISITITDNYFDYILLPDGKKTTNRNEIYSVSENNTYRFTLYSKDGTSKVNEIKIDNIDKVAPTGSCSGYYKDGKSYITISAKDNVKVKNYVVLGDTFNTSSVVINKELDNVDISIFDDAGNKAPAKCNLTNKNEYFFKDSNAVNKLKVSNFYAANATYYSYWLYVPNDRENLPIIVFLHGSGEAGNDYSTKKQSAITWGFGRDIRNGYGFNSIIIMPQSHGNWYADTRKMIVDLVNKVADEYKADKSRIVISGFSLGCKTVLETVKDFPNFFSKAVPIECWGAEPFAPYFKDVPVWTFASQTVTNETMSAFSNKVKAAGGTAKHSYYANYGHSGLVGHKMSIFTDPDLKLVEWMVGK